MTKQEFISKLREMDAGSAADAKQEISNEDYRTIETVYTWHPAIGEVTGKEQIAGIYMYGGMGVIRDMLPTAAKARRIEGELQALRAQEHNLKAELERLKTGEEVEIG